MLGIMSRADLVTLSIQLGAEASSQRAPQLPLINRAAINTALIPLPLAKCLGTTIGISRC